MLIGGVHNTVDDFDHSNSNAVEFDSNTSGNTLSASNTNGTGVEFLSGSVNDAITLMGITGDLVFVDGSGLVADVVDPTSGGNICTVNSVTAAGGTKSNPAIVIC